jgi:hypothetical protein
LTIVLKFWSVFQVTTLRAEVERLQVAWDNSMVEVAGTLLNLEGLLCATAQAHAVPGPV